MRHYQEQYIMYDEKTGQMLDEHNWVADPVSADNVDDVLSGAIAGLMRDRDLTEENSTVDCGPDDAIRIHTASANIYYWNGTMGRAVRELIIVHEVIIWDDLDLNELDPKARELYETWDWCGSGDPLLECSNIEELNEMLLAYGGSDND